MITKNWELTVDFDKDVTYTPARFVAGDHGSCSITLKTIQTITGLRVVISFSMSDGTNYVEEAAVTDSNTAILSLPSGVLSVAGRVNCQVAVYSTTQRLTHAVGFFYTVSADLADEAIEASDQYPILTQLITDCEKIEDAEVLRVIAEGEADPRSGRVGAELDREDAEIARVAAEAARAVFEAYDSDKEYVAGNKVSEAGSSYVALINSVGKNPATEPSCWLMIAEKGAQGIQGPQGPQGPQGAQGIPGGDITTAAELAYDNTGSGLVANNTQAAIDEVKALISSNLVKINEKTSYGVYTGLVVAQQTVADMTVKVSAGTIYMANFDRFAIDAVASIAVTAADSTNPRIDIVYVSSVGAITYLAGTAAASPSAPATPAGGQKIAEINVAAGATSIVTANIVDRRKFLWTEAWIRPTLLNSWVNVDVATYDVVSFAKDALGCVDGKGLAKSGTVGYATPIYVLPVGYRPEKEVYFPAASNNAYGTIVIKPNGSVYCASGSNTWFSVRFRFRAGA